MQINCIGLCNAISILVIVCEICSFFVAFYLRSLKLYVNFPFAINVICVQNIAF